MMIYRVQDLEGRGPWRAGMPPLWVDPQRDRSHLAPNIPLLESILWKSTRGMFTGYGCRKLKLLRQWFSPDEYAKLRELGYHAVRMPVGRILGSSTLEIVFERKMPFTIGAVPVELYAEASVR